MIRWRVADKASCFEARSEQHCGCVFDQGRKGSRTAAGTTVGGGCGGGGGGCGGGVVADGGEISVQDTAPCPATAARLVHTREAQPIDTQLSCAVIFRFLQMTLKRKEGGCGGRGGSQFHQKFMKARHAGYRRRQ